MADAARQMSHAEMNDEPSIVVIGRDGTKPPRGSWYAANDIDAAEAGATAMGLQAVAVTGSDVMALANRVPKGRVFSSGKLFMPRIQKEVYEQLEGHLSEVERQPRLELVASGDDKGRDKEAGRDSDNGSPGNGAVANIKGTLPGDWSKLGVGSLVLTRDIEEESDAFYLAVVLGKPSPTTLTLKWRDYPDIGTITRNVQQIAMLHPKVDIAELEWDEE